MPTSVQEVEALVAAGKWVEAATGCAELCRRRPGNARVWHMAASVERRLGHVQRALACYRRALELEPQSSVLLLEYGMALQAAGEPGEALSVLQQVLLCEPDSARAHHVLGGLLFQQGRLDEAKCSFEKALHFDHDMIEALLGLCGIWNALERHDEVIACLQRAISLRPRSHELHFNLGLLLESLGRLEESQQECRRTLALCPDHLPAIALQAGILRRQGRYPEALRLLDTVVGKGVTHPRIIDAYVKLCHRVERCEHALVLAQTVLMDPHVPEQDLMCLHFSTGHLLDRLGRYDEAFAHFQQANRLRRAGQDVIGLQRQVDEIMHVHASDPALMLRDRQSTAPKLIFIVGMPRSGTTLVEQILASHPDVYGAGELQTMPSLAQSIARLTGASGNYPQCMPELNPGRIDILRRTYLSGLPHAALGAPVVTDKQPGNFLTLGLIRALFPNAAIIHCTRDPRDTCLSCYFHNFQGLPYTYDLASLGQTWRIYRRLMQHWKDIQIPMLELPYEALVDDVEGWSRRLLEYCGLPWNDACLRFHENDRIVSTVSHDQVTRPIYTSSVGRWRHYERHLGPLLIALQEVGRA